jgi:polyphosphate kinase
MFNYLTGYSDIREFRKLLVAPLNLRRRFHALVEREIDHAKAGRGGHLVFKCNSMVDRKLIDLLYEASCEGVQVELVIRGLCSLRPGIPGLSENITVRSLLGRYLEHSRIYYFANDGKPEIFLGSADLMTRNLDRRVETLFPVSDPKLRGRLVNEVLFANLHDNHQARLMDRDGNYTRLAPGKETPLVCQDWLFTKRGGWTP